MVACGKLVLCLRAQKSLLRPKLVLVRFQPGHSWSVWVEYQSRACSPIFSRVSAGLFQPESSEKLTHALRWSIRAQKSLTRDLVASCKIFCQVACCLLELSSPEMLTPQSSVVFGTLAQVSELRKAYSDAWWIAESSEKLTQLVPAESSEKLTQTFSWLLRA